MHFAPFADQTINMLFSPTLRIIGGSCQHTSLAPCAESLLDKTWVQTVTTNVSSLLSDCSGAKILLNSIRLDLEELRWSGLPPSERH